MRPWTTGRTTRPKTTRETERSTREVRVCPKRKITWHGSKVGSVPLGVGGDVRGRVTQEESSSVPLRVGSDPHGRGPCKDPGRDRKDNETVGHDTEQDSSTLTISRRAWQ